MTVKEAILKALNDLQNPSNSTEIFNKIKEMNYYDFGDAKTPKDTVSAQCGSFIRTGDNRVARTKNNHVYFYYLKAFENKIEDTQTIKTPELDKKDKPYDERSLHKLLSTYLKSINIQSKTIYHEKSKLKKDKNQIWTHPDMVGVKFLSLKKESSQNLLKSLNKSDMLKIYSYELKKEINSDSELKQYYFQAVSNSSWANYGYLVAFELDSKLEEELERLNQSFGIGFIKLKSNPFESEILFSAKYKEIDFKTVDKLCVYNENFENFISHLNKIINANKEYLEATKNEFKGICDSTLANDTDIAEYCKKHNIPLEEIE